MSKLFVLIPGLLFYISGSARAQIIEGFDHDAALVLSSVKLFAQSDSLKMNVPSFRASVHNTRGETVHNVELVLRIYKKRGAPQEFPLRPEGCQGDKFDLIKNQTVQLMREFAQPWPYAQDEAIKFDIVLKNAEIPTTKPGYRFTGILSKDEACFKKYAETFTLGGDQREKRVLELIEGGCLVKVVDDLEAVVMMSKTLPAAGKDLQVSLLFLHDDSYHLNPEARAESKNSEAVGWVLADEVKKGTVVKWIDLKTGRLIK